MLHGLRSFSDILPIDPFESHLLERGGEAPFHLLGECWLKNRLTHQATTSTNSSTAVTVMPEKEQTYRTKVEIVEDKSDCLIVAEARVRPGLIDPAKVLPDKAYANKHRPKKVYTFSSLEKEIENPTEGSVIVTPSECKVMIESRINRTDTNQAVKAWSVFTKFGITASQPGAILVRQEGSHDVTTQVFRVNYTDNAEWGCLILRCTNESLAYGNECYQQNELLTLFFHRTKADFENSPYPPMVTLARHADQNYAPMLPGQMLQIIPNLGATGVDDYQSQGDRCLFFHSQERLTKNGKFWAYRYECARMPQSYLPLFIKGEGSGGVIIPPVHVEDKDVFVIVNEPYKSCKVLCDNLTSLRLRFAKSIPVVEFPTKFIEIPRANTKFNELTVRFLKKLGTVTILNEKGTCSISCTLPGFGTAYPPTRKK